MAVGSGCKLKESKVCTYLAIGDREMVKVWKPRSHVLCAV